MRYQEIKENYSPERDEHTKQEISDTRRVRLTLAHISRLRKIREYRKFEREQKKSIVTKIYKKGGDEDTGMPDL